MMEMDVRVGLYWLAVAFFNLYTTVLFIVVDIYFLITLVSAHTFLAFALSLLYIYRQIHFIITLFSTRQHAS